MILPSHRNVSSRRNIPRFGGWCKSVYLKPPRTPHMNTIVEYCSTNAVSWTAVFCGQSFMCLQAVFRKGQTLLLCYIFSFQVHNLPSCPVLKNFQQTVERRSVDSLLFLLEDGSRWLPVSIPPALGVVRFTQGGWAAPAYCSRWTSFLICCMPPPEATAPSWGLCLSHLSPVPWVRDMS